MSEQIYGPQEKPLDRATIDRAVGTILANATIDRHADSCAVHSPTLRPCSCGLETRLRASLLTAERERDEALALYCGLLFMVERKFPNETRHETALRYIREAERGASSAALKHAGEETKP